MACRCWGRRAVPRCGFSHFFSQRAVFFVMKAGLPSARVCLGREAGLATRAVLLQPRFDGQRAVDMGVTRSPIREIAFFWRITCKMLGRRRDFARCNVSKSPAGF